MVRSYLGYYTGSHQNSAVKRLWAGIVLGWVTSREVPVPHPPFWPFAEKKKNPENRNVKRLFWSQTLPTISAGSKIYPVGTHAGACLPVCIVRHPTRRTRRPSLWCGCACRVVRACVRASQGAEPYPARRQVTSRRPPRGLNTLLSNLFRMWTT